MKTGLKISAIALAAVLGFGVLAHQNNAEAQMTKTEIESIIEEYIMNNPEKILQSVTDYQTRGVVEQQQQALNANERQLFDSETTPAIGPEDAAVRVVEFFDYNCGFCKRVINDVNRMMEEHEDVRVIFKEFPILGPASELAARWALAAHNQGQYLEFHNAVLSAQDRVSEEQLLRIANELNLDVNQLRADANSDEVTAEIEANRALAQELGVTGTPAFIFEDEIIPGAIDYNAMSQAIESKRATQR